jgi:hypothetical protein
MSESDLDHNFAELIREVVPGASDDQVRAAHDFLERTCVETLLAHGYNVSQEYVQKHGLSPPPVHKLTLP